MQPASRAPRAAGTSAPRVRCRRTVARRETLVYGLRAVGSGYSSLGGSGQCGPVARLVASRSWRALQFELERSSVVPPSVRWANCRARPYVVPDQSRPRRVRTRLRAPPRRFDPQPAQRPSRASDHGAGSILFAAVPCRAALAKTRPSLPLPPRPPNL